MKLLTLSLIALFFSGAYAQQPGTYRERTLVDFSDRSAEAWPALNDGVMGGRSSGSAELRSGRMVFAGQTRLENNGGFSSIRSRGNSWSISGANELLVRMRGSADRGYTFILETSAGSRGMRVNYWHSFRLVTDGWQTVRLPLSDFYPQFRGRKLRGPALDLSDLQSLGLMVYDKKAGPFRAEVAWVKAGWYEEGPTEQGELTRATRPDPESARVLDASRRAERGANIVTLAQGAGKFQTLLAAATKAGLAQTLQGEGPFTVLAPTDSAFEALPDGVLASLLQPENRDQLRGILLFHVIPGRLSASDLLAKRSVETAQGQDLPFSIRNGRFRAGEATVTLNDLEASNGIVHAIDRVLLPEPETTPAQRLIQGAIDRGVDQFNADNPDACAAIYEVAIMALLELDPEGMSAPLRRHLSDILAASAEEKDRRAAAWSLRRTLDVAWNRLGR